MKRRKKIKLSFEERLQQFKNAGYISFAPFINKRICIYSFTINEFDFEVIFKTDVGEFLNFTGSRQRFNEFMSNFEIEIAKTIYNDATESLINASPIFPDDFIINKPLGVAKIRLLRTIKERGTIRFYRYILKYDVGANWLKTNIKPMRVKSRATYMKYSKHPAFPLFLPCDPGIFYKDNGWISYGHFLGTDNVCNPTVYKNMTSEIIQAKKDELCAMIEFGEVKELLPIYELFKNNNEAPLYEYYSKYRSRIIKIVKAVIKEKRLPFPPDGAQTYFYDGYFRAVDILRAGKFRPHKLINRTPLYSFLATFLYVHIRNNVIWEGGKHKIRINAFTEKYHKELQTEQ